MALNDSHWCDRCPSRAYSEITLSQSGFKLWFCAHHLRRHYDELVMQGADIVDETKLLTAHITDDKHVV